MTNVIQIKRGSGVPNGKLAPYELGINTSDFQLYVGGPKSGDNYGNAKGIRVAEANKLTVNGGSSTKPVYFNNGIPSECGATLDVNITGNAATATTATTATYLPAQSSGAGISNVERYVFMSWTNLSAQQITYHSTLTYNTQTQTLTAPNFNGALAWSKITGKPSTFEPSTHTHNYIPLGGPTETLKIKKSCPTLTSNTTFPAGTNYGGPKITFENGGGSETLSLNFTDSNSYWNSGQALVITSTDNSALLFSPFLKSVLISASYGTGDPPSLGTTNNAHRHGQLYFKVVS